MAGREAFGHADRPRFVGFKPVNLTQRLRAGAHFIPTGKAQMAENDQGFMSSVAFSPELNHWIGLGFLERGPERIGERLIAADPLRGESIEVEVCKPAFVDPGEERLRV
jgi:sarcosine oxidase subunit alpha